MKKIISTTLLAVILTVGLVAGCSASGKQIESAIEACKDRGGIDNMHTILIINDAHCKDGFTFNLYEDRN